MEVDDLFRDEYDQGAIKRITTRRFGFDLLVTPRFTWHFQDKAFEEMTGLLIRQIARGVGAFFDVGAHYGFYSVLVGLSNPECKIFAFEPIPQNCTLLRENLELNGLTAAVAEAAVGDHPGHAAFEMSAASDNSGFIANPNARTLADIDVDVVTLDQFVDQIPDGPVMVKIDTEGSEIRVLEGMRGLLEARDDVRLVVELNPKCLTANGYSPEALLGLLEQLGFDIFVVDDGEMKYVRYRPGSEWALHVGTEAYRNLYCVKKDRSLNLVFFSHSSYLAGSERSLLELVSDAVEDHGAVCTVFLPGKGPLERLLNERGVATIRGGYFGWCTYDTLPNGESTRRLEESLGWLSRELGELEAIGADAICTNTLTIPWGALAAALTRLPHVWRVNEFGELGGLRFFLPFHEVISAIKGWSNRVIAVCVAVRDTLFGDSGSDVVEVIYRHIPVPQEIQAAEGAFTQAGSFRVLAPGTIMPSKGQEDAVLATIELAKNRGFNLELTIAGYSEPVYLKKLEALVRDAGMEDRIHILNFQEDIFPLMAATDVVLVCSRHEAFGRVVLEAMRMRKPVIGANQGGIPEMISNGETGLLYEPGDIGGLADKIQGLIEGEELRTRLAERGFGFAQAKFTKAKTSERFWQLVMELKGADNPAGRNGNRWILDLSVSRLREQQGTLAGKESEILRRDEEIAQLESQLTEQGRRIVDLESSVARSQHLATTLARRDEELLEIKGEWADLRSRLDTVHASTGLRLLQRYWAVRDYLFPLGSLRRSVYSLPMGVLRALAGMDKDTFWLAARDLKESPQIRGGGLQTSTAELVPSEPGEDAGPLRVAFKQQLLSATNQGLEDYVPIASGDFPREQMLPKLIAFYLPQFHPIPENDAWWGKGFTEWTNVSKAVPQFVGHYQPRLPGEMGFYDLRVPEVQKRQIELARKYGIYGFCFHYYWFAGKRLLERPLEQFLQSGQLDFPFCLCWANENWTRRWDGAEHEVLISQDHTPQTDVRFIEDVIPALRDPRYIRIGDRPLLIVYRPSILPDPLRTVEVWRDHCNKAGVGAPYLVAAQTFGFTDPRALGFDGAVQFPPHNTRPRPVTHKVKLLNPDFRGNVHDYEELVDRLPHAPEEPPPYDLFWTVFPGWDNEARKPGAGRMFIHATPEAYKKWLVYAAQRTLENHEPEKQIVFINAWNEWAEGAYLEPDRRYGYAFLQATSDALRTIHAARGSEPQEEKQEALIATIPRSGTLMLVTFLKMYDYLLALPSPDQVERDELFRHYDEARFHNIGFAALHIGHGYCPGYEEFGEGATKEMWDAIEGTPQWFDEAGAWIRENRYFLYPHLNPRATIVFVHRNPFDFVVSMFRHFEHHKDRPDEQPLSLDEFIEMVMPQYLKTYVSYVEGQQRYPHSFCLVSYESLMQDRAGALRSILEFLRRPVGAREETAFRVALRYTQPPVMRELELFLGETLAHDQRASVEEVSHMRGGQVGKFREVLEPRQIARITDYLRDFNLRPEDFGVALDCNLQPGISRNASSGSPSRSTEIFDAFHGLNDDEWIEIIVHSPDRVIVGGVHLPGLPEADLQWRLVGSSGSESLRDASRFYREIKRYCARQRIPLGVGSRILDFGCGIGRHLRYFLKDVPAEGLVGMDVTPETVEASLATLPMCRFHVIEPWPPTSQADASYNLVYAYSVFSHLNREIADAWIGEFARILRPGGILVLTTHSRALIDYAGSLRRKSQYDHPWEYRIARRAFLDGAGAHQQYDRGEFLYACTGDHGTGAFDPSLYGNAIVSPGYVRSHWVRDFDLIDYVDDRERLQQTIIVLSRKGQDSKSAIGGVPADGNAP